MTVKLSSLNLFGEFLLCIATLQILKKIITKYRALLGVVENRFVEDVQA